MITQCWNKPRAMLWSWSVFGRLRVFFFTGSATLASSADLNRKKKKTVQNVIHTDMVTVLVCIKNKLSYR